MISLNLYRRHKAGLFLVLVATGLSLFFEASAKQTAGIVLLGVAATWLLGSLSLRTLGLASCSLACALGLFIAVFPLHQQWVSTIASAAEYDFALAEIRAAVARAPVWEVVPPPPGYKLDQTPAVPPPSQIQGLPQGAELRPIGGSAGAQQAGATSSQPSGVDYAALAKKSGAISSVPRRGENLPSRPLLYLLISLRSRISMHRQGKEKCKSRRSRRNGSASVCLPVLFLSASHFPAIPLKQQSCRNSRPSTFSRGRRT